MLKIENISDRIKFKDLKGLFNTFGNLTYILLDIDTNHLIICYSDEKIEQYVYNCIHGIMLAGRKLRVNSTNVPKIRFSNKISITNFPKEDKEELTKEYKDIKLLSEEGLIIECKDNKEAEMVYDSLHGRWYNKRRIKCNYV